MDIWMEAEEILKKNGIKPLERVKISIYPDEFGEPIKECVFEAEVDGKIMLVKIEISANGRYEVSYG